jgi:NADPH:quinone reductase-like Zn-dependent oxidoreductase
VIPARSGTVLHRVVPAHLACHIAARAQARERNAWPAVVSVALVVPAVAAAGAAPPLALCSARLERRRVLEGSLAAGSLALRAGQARPSALRRQARQIWPARDREAPAPPPGTTDGAGKTPNEHAEICRLRPYRGRCQKGTAMPNAIVMTGYGPPEVLKWAGVPLPEPGEGQIRIKVKAAGISPTDLALRAGYLKAIPLPPNAVLGFEAAGTVDAVGPGVTGTSVGDAVTALLFSLGGYAEYAVASIWTRKPGTVSWIDAAALPSSAEAAAGVLRQLNVTSGETLLLFGGGGSVGIIATQLAVARGVTVISALGEHDETLARELGATPVRYGPGVAGRVRALGAIDAVFDAAGTGVLADAIALAGGPERVITLSDPAAADFGVTLSQPTPDRAPGALDETIALLADGRLRLRAHQTMPMQQAAEAHRQLECGTVHQRIILTLP